MSLSESALLEVLRIGHVTSIRSKEGLSLRKALARAKYRALRPEIELAAIIGMLRKHPHLVKEWVMYSEDKRTHCGWYIKAEDLEIGRVDMPNDTRLFKDLDEAVAEFILKELDYWAGIRRAV